MDDDPNTDDVPVRRRRSSATTPITHVGGFGKPDPTNTLGEARREASRIYQRMCAGAITPTEAAKATWMLQTTAKLIENEAFESRLQALEGGRQNRLADHPRQGSRG